MKLPRQIYNIFHVKCHQINSALALGFLIENVPCEVTACVIRMLIDVNIMIKIKMYILFTFLGLDLGSYQVSHIFAGFWDVTQIIILNVAPCWQSIPAYMPNFLPVFLDCIYVIKFQMPQSQTEPCDFLVFMYHLPLHQL